MSPLSEPVLQGEPHELLEALSHAALLPGGGRDLARVGEIIGESSVHLARESLVDDAYADLVVVHEAAPVEIGGAYRGPHTVHDDGLGMQEGALELVQAHAALEQIVIVGASRVEHAREIAVRGQDHADGDT